MWVVVAAPLVAQKLLFELVARIFSAVAKDGVALVSSLCTDMDTSALWGLCCVSLICLCCYVTD